MLSSIGEVNVTTVFAFQVDFTFSVLMGTLMFRLGVKQAKAINTNNRIRLLV